MILCQGVLVACKYYSYLTHPEDTIVAVHRPKGCLDLRVLRGTVLTFSAPLFELAKKQKHRLFLTHLLPAWPSVVPMSGFEFATTPRIAHLDEIKPAASHIGDAA